MTARRSTSKTDTRKQDANKGKKLRLNKGTLRDLTDRQGAVKGGFIPRGCSYDESGCV